VNGACVNYDFEHLMLRELHFPQEGNR